jgi:RNA polymerase sigma-70 factor (ECF subfamily)
MTLSEAQQLERAPEAAEEAFLMDERTFRTLYERTARPLWSYLYRMSCDAALADDLMQEAYYRILRARLPEMNQDYMKNYLFRIATNLLRDHWRKAKSECLTGEDESAIDPKLPKYESDAEAIHVRSDLEGVLNRMKPGERELLWLAYVEGSSHKEIAGIVGLKEQSIRPLLFRARRKLASLLRGRGLITRV